MKNTTKGFTLIELLVVVLIIGILSSIALPQYQKAVDKAHAAEIVQIIAAIQKGLELWMLANPGQSGSFLEPDSTNMLEGVDIPCEYKKGDTRCYINKNYFLVKIMDDGYARIHASMDGVGVLIEAARTSQGNWSHKCYYDATNTRQTALCKGLTGYVAV